MKSSLDKIDRGVKRLLVETPASDSHEKSVADAINSVPGVKAERPKVGPGFADVRVTVNGNVSWLEVKMNHTDNLSNPRVYFDGTKWDTTYTTPVAKYVVEQLNKSNEPKEFIKSLKKFLNLDPRKKIKIPTTKSGLREPDSVSMNQMRAYFDQPGVDTYIMRLNGVNVGSLVTQHYTKGKDEPAYYMQAADDFYMISNRNPLGLPNGIPLFKGTGSVKVRISVRSEYIEIKAEVKIDSMPSSKYSALKGSKKINPFKGIKGLKEDVDMAKPIRNREKYRLLQLSGLNESQIRTVLSEAKDIEIQFDFDEPSIESKEVLASLKKAGFSAKYKPGGGSGVGSDFVHVQMPSSPQQRRKLADWITKNFNSGDAETTKDMYPELFR